MFAGKGVEFRRTEGSASFGLLILFLSIIVNYRDYASWQVRSTGRNTSTKVAWPLSRKLSSWCREPNRIQGDERSQTHSLKGLKHTGLKGLKHTVEIRMLSKDNFSKLKKKLDPTFNTLLSACFVALVQYVCK